MSTARIVSGAPIVLATGGTGGDVFPAQALAAELTARGHRVVLITDARGAAFDEASEVHRIRAATPGRSPAQLAIAARDIGLGTVAAFRLLRRLHPAAVVGFGGYASVPTMLAAGWLRLPTLRSEDRRVGKEFVSTCRSLLSPYLYKKKKT